MDNCLFFHPEPEIDDLRTAADLRVAGALFTSFELSRTLFQVATDQRFMEFVCRMVKLFQKM
jgi:hypothetical protein